MLETKGNRNSDGSFNWKDGIIDAVITGAITFFTTLGAVNILNPEPEIHILEAGVAAAGQFFIFLGMKRGLTKE